MTKAKLIKNQRQTRNPNLKSKRKQTGRPKGTLKKYRFEETRLGFLLKYEVPTVYEIIMSLTQPDVFQEPPYLLVKLVCEKSTDPSLTKKKFIRYLEDYRDNGLYCKRPKKLTPERESYYTSLRKRKMTAYIIDNLEKIERHKSLLSIDKKSILKQLR